MSRGPQLFPRSAREFADSPRAARPRSPGRRRPGGVPAEPGRLKVSLVRVRYGDQPPIWLFAPETLHDVPNFHGDFEPSFVEQYLPAWLVHGYGTNYWMWSWAAMLASWLAAFIVAVLLARALGLLFRRTG